MRIRSDRFDHRLEALETRSLLSAALPADMPRLLTGDLPVVTDDFLSPQDEADPVDLGGDAGGWTGDNADVPMFFEDAGNADFDAGYRDWTWELDGTQIDGGQGYEVFPGFGTVDCQMAGLPASATIPRISERAEVDQTLPHSADATISDAELGADMGFGDEPYGPAVGMHSGIAAPRIDDVKIDAEPGVGVAPTLPVVQTPGLFEAASFSDAAEKRGPAKVSLIASYVGTSMPRSDALVLPTLL